MRKLLFALCLIGFLTPSSAVLAQEKQKDEAVAAYTPGASATTQPPQTTSTTLPPNAPVPPAQATEEEDSITAGFDTGIDSLYKGEDLKGANNPNLPEAYPSGAYSINQNLGLTNLMGKAVNGAVNVAVMSVVTLWSFTTKLYQDNLVNGPPGGIGQAGESMVRALGGGVLAPWLPLALAFAVFGMVAHFYRNRYSALPFDVAWVCGMMALFFFLSSAYPIVREKAVEASRAPGLALLKPLTIVEKPPAPKDEVLAPTYEGDETKAGLRIMADKSWRGLVMPFYGIIQFGSLEAGELYSERWLASRTFVPTEEEKQAIAGGLYVDRGLDPPPATTKDRAVKGYVNAPEKERAIVQNARERYRSHQQGLKDEINQNPDTKDFFQGKRWPERAVLAFVFVLVAGILGLLLLWVVFCSWVYVSGFELLFMGWPIFMLPMLIPGIGQQSAKNYAKILFNILLAAAVLTAAPIIALVLLSTLLSAGVGSSNWFVTLMGGLATVMAVMIFRHKIREIYAGSTIPHYLRDNSFGRAGHAALPGLSWAGAAFMGPRSAVRGFHSGVSAIIGDRNRAAEDKPEERGSGVVPRTPRRLAPMKELASKTGAGAGAEAATAGHPAVAGTGYLDGAADSLAPTVAVATRTPTLPRRPGAQAGAAMTAAGRTAVAKGGYPDPAPLKRSTSPGSPSVAGNGNGNGLPNGAPATALPPKPVRRPAMSGPEQNGSRKELPPPPLTPDVAKAKPVDGSKAKLPPSPRRPAPPRRPSLPPGE